jgi:hypothetical protein
MSAPRQHADAPSMVSIPRTYVMLAILWSAGLAFTVVDVEAAQLTFDLRIESGHLPENMRLVRVTEGDVVRLRWSVDRPVILHLHGYDIEKRVEPGVVGEMTFTARTTGRFPLHAHAIATQPAQAHDETPLLYIEVYPR